jgi:DNA adenine methylase
MKPQRLLKLVEPQTAPAAVALPFVKWVGGKRALLPSIKSHLPARFNDYHEPFLGGGAVFFAVGSKAKKAFLSDRNLDLVITYRVIIEEPTHLIERLRQHAEAHQENAHDHYYEVRAAEPTEPVEVAARFIYLNKTCFNGLYRVNRRGQFNVPIGSYKNPNIVQEENILACHQALKNAVIKIGNFDSITPRKGDLVYFDPPYHPLNDTSFTAYTQDNFHDVNQIELRDFALRLHKQGVFVMLSNSHCDFIRDLYASKVFKKHIVQAPRSVNSKADARGAVDEYLITNY